MVVNVLSTILERGKGALFKDPETKFGGEELAQK